MIDELKLRKARLLNQLDTGNLSRKESTDLKYEIGVLLEEIEKLEGAKAVKNEKLAALVKGKYDGLEPDAFLNILKTIIDEIGDVEPVKEPTRKYIEQRVAA